MFIHDIVWYLQDKEILLEQLRSKREGIECEIAASEGKEKKLEKLGKQQAAIVERTCTRS